MKLFLAIIGASHMIFFVLGAMDIVDYHLCIKANSECKKQVTK